MCVCVAVCVAMRVLTSAGGRYGEHPPAPRHSPWLKAAGVVTLTSAGLLFLAGHAPARMQISHKYISLGT